MVITLLKRLGALLLVSLIGFAGVAGPGPNSKAMGAALSRELRETSDSIVLQRSVGDHDAPLHTWAGTDRGGNP